MRFEDIKESALMAVDTLRTRTGSIDQRTYATSGPMVERILASEHAAVFEAARERGRAMSRREALRYAFASVDVEAAPAAPAVSA